jgi:tetratricopeptide (TPR) repeat protein
MGHFAEARKAVEEALKIHQSTPALTSLEVGVDQFIRASSFAVMGDYPAAVQAFNNASQFLARCGPGAYPLLTRVYSDLAMAYAQERDLKSAEEATIKSIASERGENKPDPAQDLLVKDSLSHIEFDRGRISEAINNTRQLLVKYGTNTRVSIPLRVHVYEDYASLCLQQHKISKAIEYFQVSLGLEKEMPIRGGLARTLALLGRAQMLDSHLDDAEESLTEAMQPSHAFEPSPVDRALVVETYGELLIARHRWNEARTALKNALTHGQAKAGFTNVQLAAWTNLAEADHHLHLRKEEKESRKQAKLLMAGFQYPDAKDVVDVATLKNSYVDNH